MGVTGLRLRFGGQELPVPVGTVELGRMPDCWLVLTDDQVSRYHARITYDGTTGEVEDRGSRNGTYVNGRRVQGRVQLVDGDQLGIGREVLVVSMELMIEQTLVSGERRRATVTVPTMAPSSFGLMGGLIEKSVSMSRFKEAERYAGAAMSQMSRSDAHADSAAVESCVRAILHLAERTSSGLWLDRIFRLYAVHGWIMSDDLLEQVRRTLDRIPRVPGTGLADYELALRSLKGEGVEISSGLLVSVAELSDTFGNQ